MRFSTLAMLFPLAAFTACSGESSAPVGSTSAGLTGPIELRLVNTEDLSALAAELSTATKVVVTLTRIDARIGKHGDGDDGGWTTVLSKTETVDLLSIRGGTFASLGIGNLPAGSFEQLRLFVSPTGPNYVTTADGATHPLLVPSSAVRVVGDFDTESCSSGHVTLELAGRHSIVVAPDADGRTAWMLRPVLHLREVVAGCPVEGHGEPEGPDKK